MADETDKDVILRDLLVEAEKRFGGGRLEALRETLDATAAELAQVRSSAVSPDVEPMFYPDSTD